MRKRLMALLITGAFALTLLGVSVLAANDDPSVSQPTEAEAGAAEEGQAASQENETVTPPDEGDGDETPEDEESSQEEYVPDPVGYITFENLERRLREHNLSLLTLEENIQAIEVIDYDAMYETLRENMNNIASVQWTLVLYGMGETPEAKALQQSYDALRETFDSLKKGELQKDNEDALWQLKSAQNQVIMAGESLYIAIMEMEQNKQTLDRNLAALDRSLQELELR